MPQKFRPRATNIQGAADYLGVSKQTIYRLIKAGELHPARIGRRVLIRISELDDKLDDTDREADILRELEVEG